jgi:hypothetical protein
VKTSIIQGLLTIGTAFMVGLTSSCSPLHSTAPIGTEPIPLAPDEWDGDWITPDGKLCSVKVTDPENGQMLITPRHLELLGLQQPHLAYFRSYRNWRFLSATTVSDDGEVGSSGFIFGRALRVGDEFLVWESNAGPIRAAMEGGELPTAADESVSVSPSFFPNADASSLGELKEEHIGRLTRNPEELLFGVGAHRYTRVPREASQ